MTVNICQSFSALILGEATSWERESGTTIQAMINLPEAAYLNKKKGCVDDLKAVLIYSLEKNRKTNQAERASKSKL